MEVLRALSVEVGNAATVEVKSLCFHPYESVVCVGLPHEIRVIDLASGTITGRVTIEDRLAFVGFNPSHNYLIACTVEGFIYAWVFDTLSPLVVFSIKKEAGFRQRNPPVVCFTTALVDPYACYSRQSSKDIYVFNLLAKNSSFIKLDAKKAPSDLACHPSQPILAAFCTDGVVRVWDYLSETLCYTSDDFIKVGSQQNIIYAPPNFLAFHPTEDLLVAAGETGLMVCWSLNQNSMSLVASGNAESKITTLQFHPYLPFLFSVTSNGVISLLSWGGKRDYFGVYNSFKSISIIETEMKLRYTNAYLQSLITLDVNRIHFHPTQNYFAFTFTRQQKTTAAMVALSAAAPNTKLGIYAIRPLEPAFTLTKAMPLQLPHSGFFSQERSVFHYSAEVPYISQGGLYKYTLSTNESSLIKKLPENFYGQKLMPTSFIFSEKYHKYIVSFEMLSPGSPETSYFYTVLGADGFLPGKMGQFLGKDQKYFGILSEDGTIFEVFSTKSDEKESEVSFMPRKMKSCYPHPKGILFVTEARELIYADESLILDEHQSFKLESDEEVIQALWQNNDRKPSLDLLGLITTKRICVLSSSLNQLICSVRYDSLATRPFVSGFWLDNALLFTTDSHLQYLTMDGSVHHLFSIKDVNATICAVLNDRIVYATTFKDQVKMKFHSIGLLQPLLIAQLALKGDYALDPVDLKGRLQRIISRFDSVRTNQKLVKILDKTGHPDIAFALVHSSPFYSPWRKIELALHAHRFDTAYEILRNWLAPKKKRRREAVSPQSECYITFKRVAEIFMHFGQFALAQKCLETIKDDFGLLHLYVINRCKKGIQTLVTKNKDDATKKLLLTACEYQLKHRKLDGNDALSNWPFETNQSTDWTITQVTGATMKIGGKSKEEFIQPIGLLDSITKWLSVSAVDVEYTHPTTEIDEKEIIDETSNSESNSLVVDRLHPPPLGNMSSKIKTTCTVSSITKRRLIVEEDSETSCWSESLASRKEGDDDTSDEEEGSLTTKSPLTARKKKVRSRLISQMEGKAEEVRSKSPDIVSGGTLLLHHHVENHGPPESPVVPPTPVISAEMQDAINLAKRYGSMCLTKLDQGQFSGALDDINQSISTFVSSPDPKSVQHLVRACLAYKLALKLLIEVKLQEKSKNIQRLAQLARFLAEVPLQPHHRLICLRFAINKNMETENWQYAVKYLQIILSRKDLPDAHLLEQKLKKCKDNIAKKEAQGAPGSIGAAVDENAHKRFCYQSFQPFTRVAVVVGCPYCEASYSEKIKKPGEKCVYCNYGVLEKAST